jgi:hypothetical protein
MAKSAAEVLPSMAQMEHNQGVPSMAQQEM